MARSIILTKTLSTIVTRYVIIQTVYGGEKKKVFYTAYFQRWEITVGRVTDVERAHFQLVKFRPRHSIDDFWREKRRIHKIGRIVSQVARPPRFTSDSEFC